MVHAMSHSAAAGSFSETLTECQSFTRSWQKLFTKLIYRAYSAFLATSRCLNGATYQSRRQLAGAVVRHAQHSRSAAALCMRDSL
jgi:hypothetical protein